MKNSFSLKINKPFRRYPQVELTNISNANAENIRFQLFSIVPDGEKGVTQLNDVKVDEVNLLKPNETTILKFDNLAVIAEMMDMEIDLEDSHKYEKNDGGYSLRIFFEHPKEAFQVIQFWTS